MIPEPAKQPPGEIGRGRTARRKHRDQEPSGVHTYRRLLGYVRGHWKVFLLAVLGMIGYALTDTAFAALMKPLLNGGFVDRDPLALQWVPVWLLLIFLARGVCGFASSYCMSWVGWKVITTLRQQMFDRLLGLPTRDYDNTLTGDLLAKLTYNVERVADAATNAVTILIRDTATIIGLMAWMFYLHAMLAASFLLIGPAILLLVVYISRSFRRTSRKIQSSVGRVTHVVEEVIEGHRVVKIFGGQEYEQDHFGKINERNRKLRMRMSVTKAASVPIVQFIVALALAGIIFVATSDPGGQSIDVGSFMSFMTAMLLLFAPLKRLTTVNAQLQQGIAAGESVFALLDKDAEQDTGSRELDRVHGEIEFRDLRFAYDASKGEVLKGVNLRIEPGQTVALVGRSGSGKSTLVNLLARLYEPTEGQILIGGEDIRGFRLASLRDQIAYVGQDVTLFNDSIANNIAYGRLASASREAIAEAARAAHAAEFIEALPQGYDTPVGENGVLLSGGQRQRLAIARALLKNAPILILDEATSALDTESERYVQAGLKALLENRTTLVIAHRLSTIEHANLIVVMDAGQIVETGTHQALLARDGAYASLHRLQFADAPEAS